MYAIRSYYESIRSHQVSSPSVAESLPPVGRPNACNLCHLDRTLAWTRITSYNVCYTKLLRPRTLKRLLAEHGPDWPARVLAAVREGQPFAEAFRAATVITSYSIHYTKLYELAGSELGSRAVADTQGEIPSSTLRSEGLAAFTSLSRRVP